MIIRNILIEMDFQSASRYGKVNIFKPSSVIKLRNFPFSCTRARTHSILSRPHDLIICAISRKSIQRY